MPFLGLKPKLTSYFFFFFQEEQYEHLDEAEVQKADKLVGEAMIWMNSKMNQQSKQSLSADPAVKVTEIQSKTKVRTWKWYSASALR